MTHFKSVSEAQAALYDTKFGSEGGSCFECCDYEEMMAGMKNYVKSVFESGVEVGQLKKRGQNKCRRCGHKGESVTPFGVCLRCLNPTIL